MSKPTANWEKVGKGFYRKIQLYTQVFDEDLELGNYLIAGAPNSGAIAFYRNAERIQTYRGNVSGKSNIDIYSCSGRLIRRINWESGIVKGLGWSEDEKLLVVTESGAVRCYLDLQSDFVPFTLGHDVEGHSVVSCRFWSNGFVALLGNNNLIEVSNYTEPRPQLLATPPGEHISSWTLIPPGESSSRSVEVLLAIHKTLLVVDATDAEDRGLDAGPFQHVSVSPNGNYVALYTSDGKVWVVSSDFQNRLLEHASGVKSMPKDLQWCGNDAVALAWEDEVHLIGFNGSSAKYYYDGWVHLIPDIDGIRLFTSAVCEFLERVPESTMETFHISSKSPASILLDSIDQLDRKSPKADDDIQLIKHNLDEAIDICIRSAGNEFDIHWQKQLLKAASFGKSVLDFYDSDAFVEMSETLRVLNAVRFYQIGMPLSYQQFINLTPERLIQRLLARNEYLLAIKISEFLRLPTNAIYTHWACAKVRHSGDPDDIIARDIVARLTLEDSSNIMTKQGVSFERIARAAHDEGRTRLATDLLNYEPRAGKQVPLLLRMGADELALSKAVQSGDTDLIRYVLLDLKKRLSLAQFFRTSAEAGGSVASALIEQDASDFEPAMIKDLYYQDDRRVDGALALFSEALESKDTSSTQDKLKLALKLLSESRDAFATKAIDETSKLLRAQESLQKDLSAAGTSINNIVGSSLNATLLTLIRAGHLKRALKLAHDFHVPERTLWWVQLRALVARRDWVALEELAKGVGASAKKKNPIGWEPFFNATLAAGNLKVAGMFVGKCTGLKAKDRVEMYVKCGMVPKAAEEAGRAKDLPLLMDLRARVSGDRDASEVERWIGIVQRK